MGLYDLLPDVTLMVAVSVGADLIAGAVMLALTINARRTAPSAAPETSQKEEARARVPAEPV